MEKGSSSKVLDLKSKLGNQSYLDNAITIIAEQLVYFFYSEWEDEQTV